MIKYRNKNWKIFVTRNMSLFHDSTQLIGYHRYSGNFNVPIFNEVSIVTNNGKITHIFEEEDSSNKYKKNLSRICHSRSKIIRLKNNYKKYADILLKYLPLIEKDFSLKSYKKFIRAYEEFLPGLSITATLGRIMHEELVNELSRFYPAKGKQEIEWIINIITYPKEHTPLFNSQISLLKIGKAIQAKKIQNFKKNEKIKRLVEIHLVKFSHIPINFNDNPWSLDDIYSQLEELLEIDCGKEIGKLILSHKSRVKISEKELKKINNKIISQIAFSLKTGTTLNEFRKNIISRSNLSCVPLFKEIAKIFKLDSWREILKLTPDEIENLYFRKSKKILKILSKRKTAGIEYFNGGIKILPDKIINMFLKEIPNFDNKIIKGVNELAGVVANKGKVKGIVKVILGSQDFYKFKSGDIIVTAMTSVDFVPIMKRAAAFVTNEGGITSHASIVSRELNKPCIIGTKIATQVLRDGDFVEVDANKGVVKILKRAR